MKKKLIMIVLLLGIITYGTNYLLGYPKFTMYQYDQEANDPSLLITFEQTYDLNLSSFLDRYDQEKTNDASNGHIYHVGQGTIFYQSAFFLPQTKEGNYLNITIVDEAGSIELTLYATKKDIPLSDWTTNVLESSYDHLIETDNGQVAFTYKDDTKKNISVHSAAADTTCFAGSLMTTGDEDVIVLLEQIFTKKTAE